MEKLLRNCSRFFSSGMCEGWGQKPLQSQPPTTFFKTPFEKKKPCWAAVAGKVWGARNTVCDCCGVHAAMIVGNVFNLIDIASWSNIRWDLICFPMWFTGSNEKADVGGKCSTCVVSLPLQGVVLHGKQGAGLLTGAAQPGSGSMPRITQGQDLPLGQVHLLFYAISLGTDGYVGCKPSII